MKHQLTLRRLLLYVALFAVGCGLFRADESMLIFAVCCFMAGVCCPIGYLISGKPGELIGAWLAIVITFLFVVIAVMVITFA